MYRRVLASSFCGWRKRWGFEPRARLTGREYSTTRNYAILFQPEYSLNDSFFSGIILSVQRELFEQGHDCSVGIIK